MEGVGDAVIGRLDEGAEVGPQTPGEEHAHLIHRPVVVGVEAFGGRRGLGRLGAHVRGDSHGREGNVELVGPDRIAGDLERAAEGRELGPKPAYVTARAGLPRLDGEGGDRQGASP